MTAEIKYRSDIAGLRAVAVLPILLFHAGVNQLPGGFVGVDIFFVISGYLITSIIQSELSKGEFSMMEFYRRRVARIVPALLAVLAATMFAGTIMMLPPEMKALAPSVASAAAFGSNFYFFFSADYFGSAAETMPLLHTWSLAIEEQFYIFFPVLLLLVHRWDIFSARSVVAVATGLSFLTAFAFAHFKPEAAFYLIPARAWELGLGTLVALRGFPVLHSAFARNIAAVIGLSLIAVSVLLLKSSPLFPAPFALAPCLGAALLIAYGRDAPTSRLLSVRPMRMIGDISYSLYLWHWPIITFYRLQTGIELDWIETMALVTASVFIAYLSYQWIEKPCLAKLRSGRGAAPDQIRVGPAPVVLGGIVLQLIICAIAFTLPSIAQQVRTFPEEVTQLAGHVDYRKTQDYVYQYRREVCFFGESTTKSYDWKCLEPSRSQPNLVVMGDSHAAQYWRAFSERFPQYHVIQATNSGCRPLLHAEGEKICTDVVHHVFDEMLNTSNIHAVVLAARWRDNEVSPLVETIRFLHRKNIPVLVIGPTVEYDLDFPLIMARAVLSGDLTRIDKHRDKSRRLLDERLRPLVQDAGGTYISVFSLECSAPNTSCTLLDQKTSRPYHFDYGHLTLEASRELVGRMPAP